MPVKKIAFEPSTSNDELAAVACNPVEVLVALTVTVCFPPDTPLNCTPDIPAKSFDCVTTVLQNCSLCRAEHAMVVNYHDSQL